jgi:ribonucleoside-triphosphate reductase
MSEKNKCTERTEVFSRVCGFFRPVQQWNKGKKEEFKERRNFVIKEKEHLKKSWPGLGSRPGNNLVGGPYDHTCRKEVKNVAPR